MALSADRNRMADYGPSRFKPGGTNKLSDSELKVKDSGTGLSEGDSLSPGGIDSRVLKPGSFVD